jgi:hypothetical protein
MITDSTEGKMTDSSASKKIPKKHRVLIPVRATIAVPVDVELDGDISAHEYGEYNGDTLVDATDNPEWVEAALKAANKTEMVESALVELMNALMGFKNRNPGSKTYYTPFAGAIDEQEL